MIKDYQKYIAELIGTFVLVGVCFGAICFGAGIGGIGVFGVAASFGITLMMLAYVIGPISGCHVNPAVTVAMYINKKINEKDMVFYIIMQIIGAVIGAAVVLAIISGAPGLDWDGDLLVGTANGFDDEYGGFSTGAAFLTEVVVTFIFIMAIFGATTKKVPAGFAPIPIGAALGVLHLVAIPVTNASLNPARSIAPALFVGEETAGQVWLFIVAPIAGAVLAALVWKYVLDEDAELFKPPVYQAPAGYPPAAQSYPGQPAPQSAPAPAAPPAQQAPPAQ